MLPRVQPYQNSSGGNTNSGLFEDISTRSLQTVRVGESAGKISSGSANTFVGYEAGKTNSAGSYDTFIGYQAGALNTGANYSTMIGAFAGRANKRGSECVMIGYRAGELNNDGQSFVAIGAYAMRENVSGLGSVAIGWRAAERNLDGDYNTLIGAECAQDNRSGNMNTMCGFRSGRANFRGNENTYIGAYSGYSNMDGSGNALIGFKCGENINFGDYNVAIGAYAFQNASYASCNVVIGPYAGANTVSGSGSVIIGNNANAFNTHGSDNVVIGTDAGKSNMNSKNVIIGYNTAANSAATGSVIIGTDAGQFAGGANSVIIGYDTARSFTSGDCNVFIGYGADAYQTSLSYGIAIGTINTYTNEHAISIGEEIYNQRAYSILMGFGIQSDANNSVLMGNNINIQSVIFFKDPLNFLLANSIANDALTKLGIDNISYGFSNQLLVAPPPLNTIYNYAVAGLITSNIQNSTTNRLNNNVSPNSLDLRLAVRSVILQGETMTIRDSPDLYSQVERYFWEFYGTNGSYNNPATQPLEAHSNIVLDMKDFIRQHSCNILVHFPSGVVAKNIRYFHEPYIESDNLELYIAKRVKAPTLTFSQCNIAFTQTFLDSLGLTLPLFTFDSNIITWDNYGIEGSNLGNVILAVEQPPTHVKLDKGTYNIGDTVSCILFRDQAYASTDSFTIRPILQLIDSASNQYGRPGQAVSINLDFHGSACNTNLHTAIIYNCSNIALSQTDVFRIPVPYSSNDSVFISKIWSSNAIVTYSNVAYSSNDLAIMYQEDVFNTFSDANFGSNVFAPPSYVDTIKADNNGYYAILLSPSVQSFIDYGIGSNLFGFGSLALGAQSLIDISSCNITFENFPSRYVEFSCNVDKWALVYDIFMTTNSNQYVNENSNVINTVYQKSSNIQQSYSSYPWGLVTSSLGLINSNMNALHTRQYPNTIGLSNLISITNNLSANTYPFPSLQNLQQHFSYINYKYFGIKRFPSLSYDDIIHSRIKLSSSDTVSPAYTIVVGGIDTYDIATTAIGRPVQWEDCPFSYVSSNVYNTSFIQFPQLQCDELIPSHYPVHGVYNEQTRTYAPFNPFASNDTVKLVATSNSLSELIQWNMQYKYARTEDVIYASAYKYGLKDKLYISYIFRQESSNTRPLWNTYIINYTDKLTGYTSNYTYRVSLTNSYNPAIGYSEITSNIMTSNTGWKILPANGHNTGVTAIRNIITYNYNETDYNGNYYISQPVITDYISYFTSNKSAYNSNITYSSNVDTSVLRSKACNVLTELIDSDKETWNYFSAHNSNYFLYTSNTPTRNRNISSNTVISTTPVPTLSSNAFFIDRKYIAYSNLVIYEPLYIMHRNAVFSLNGSYTCSSNFFVRSNVGPVGSFTQRDIDDGLIGMRLSMIPNNGVVRIGLCNVRVRKFEASNTIDLNNSNITYDASVILVSGPSVTIPTVFDPLRYNLPEYFNPVNVHVLGIDKGYLQSGLKCDIANINDYIYTSTSNYEYDTITFIYSSNNIATSPITCRATFLRYPYYNRQYFNLGTTTEDTSKLLYNAFNWKDVSDVITVTSTPDSSIATLNASQFTIADVIAGNVKVVFSNSNALTSFIYNTPSTTNNQFDLIPYYYYAFPRRAAAGYDITLYQYANDNSGIHTAIDTINSPLWSYSANMKFQGAAVDPMNVTVQVLDDIAAGFLWNISLRQQHAKSFQLYHLLNDHIHFIPYDPTYIPNIAVRTVLLYDDIVSPVYNITINNLYSRFKNSSISVTSRLRSALQIVDTSSAGFVSKGLSWSPATFTIPYIESNIPPTVSFPVNLVQNGVPLQSYTYGISAYASSAEIAWKPGVTSITLTVDQADSVSLAPLLNLINVATSNIQNVYFYVTHRPNNGIIQNTSNTQAEAAIRFTDYDLHDGRILYQHFGADTTTDVFNVALSTTPYDLVSNEVTVSLNVKLISRVTKNDRTYVFYDTPTEALSTPNMFAPCNLTVSSNGSYVHFLNKNFVDVRNVMQPNVNIDTCKVVDFAKTAFYISSIPESQQNQPYSRMSMDVICNNQSNAYSYNYLIDYHPAYAKILKFPFEAYLNHYVSSNVITNSNQNRYQTLQYNFNPANAGYSNLTNHVLTYFLQVQPSQDMLPSQFQNLNGSEILRTFRFTISYEDSVGANLLNMAFDHTGVAISTTNISRFYPYLSTNKVSFGKWNNILFVNDDTDNNRRASLYIGYNNTESKQLNISKNLLLNSDIGRLSFNTLSKIKISIDIESPTNYVSGSSSNFVIPGALKRSFDLSCYGTSLFIRNQEIYTSTYSLDDPNVDVQSTNVHNVVVGKNIIVRGTNNICMGNKFNTSGQNSIVIGNEIGTGDEQGQINELYQCIIIGNQSFANSISRDIISIGNNNFNALNTLPQEVINSFLSTKPIILGNNISETSIDFTINVGDVFLKTFLGGQQIYLGKHEEPVGIGFTSNAYLQPDYKMYVNGSAAMGKLTTPYLSSNNDYIPPHYPVIYCDDGSGRVALASGYRETCVIGICDACLQNAVTGLYNVYVQHTGVANVVVNSVSKGDFIYTSNSGVCASSGDMRYNYTIGKALSTGSNIVPCVLTI